MGSHPANNLPSRCVIPARSERPFERILFQHSQSRIRQACRPKSPLRDIMCSVLGIIAAVCLVAWWVVERWIQQGGLPTSIGLIVALYPLCILLSGINGARE